MKLTLTISATLALAVALVACSPRLRGSEEKPSVAQEQQKPVAAAPASPAKGPAETPAELDPAPEPAPKKARGMQLADILRSSGGSSAQQPAGEGTLPAELKVKRLVIASRIEKREPIEAESVGVDGPVTAFVEMANGGEESGDLVLTFEHESGEKVGFIELDVPGKSPRYRTWGRTRNIKKAGNWSAIVTTKDGAELARRAFEVKD